MVQKRRGICPKGRVSVEGLANQAMSLVGRSFAQRSEPKAVVLKQGVVRKHKGGSMAWQSSKGKAGLGKKRTSRKAYVYIFQAGMFCKIGWTANIEKRHESIQICNPHPVHVVALIPCVTPKAAAALELSYHRYFAHCHYRGEWFVWNQVKEAIARQKRSASGHPFPMMMESNFDEDQ